MMVRANQVCRGSNIRRDGSRTRSGILGATGVGGLALIDGRSLGSARHSGPNAKAATSITVGAARIDGRARRAFPIGVLRGKR